MSDVNPVPSSAILSVDQVLDIERRLRENRAAQHRGDPLPHNVTREEMRAALQSMRRHRNIAPKAPGGGKKPGGKASVIQIDLEGL